MSIVKIIESLNSIYLSLSFITVLLINDPYTPFLSKDGFFSQYYQVCILVIIKFEFVSFW